MANPLKDGDAKLKGLTDLLKNANATASQLPNTTETSVCYGRGFPFFRIFKIFTILIAGGSSPAYKEAEGKRRGKNSIR